MDHWYATCSSLSSPNLASACQWIMRSNVCFTHCRTTITWSMIEYSETRVVGRKFAILRSSFFFKGSCPSLFSKMPKVFGKISEVIDAEESPAVETWQAPHRAAVLHLEWHCMNLSFQDTGWPENLEIIRKSKIIEQNTWFVVSTATCSKIQDVHDSNCSDSPLAVGSPILWLPVECFSPVRRLQHWIEPRHNHRESPCSRIQI